MSGSDTVGAYWVYVTLGVPAATNVPGARQNAVSWVDAKGNLWLFGGVGNDSLGHVVWLNDLWIYEPSVGIWTCMWGPGSGDAAGFYGTQGVPADSNVPGARTGAVSWIDANGYLWLLGGSGYASSQTLGELNDLWFYQP